MIIDTRFWKAAILPAVIVAGLSPPAWAWDPGFNQPGAVGNRRIWP
jgi:hypothetical protein